MGNFGEFGKNMSEVAAYITDDPKSISDIAARFEWSEGYVCAILWNLRKQRDDLYRTGFGPDTTFVVKDSQTLTFDFSKAG